MRAVMRRCAPAFLLDGWRRYQRRRQQQANRAMSAEEVFTAIYRDNRWGGAPGEFSSGSGSRAAGVVDPYIDAIARQAGLEGFAGRRFVDLGCGDFQVGRRLLPLCGHYTGVDIVRSLVERNRAEFGNARTEFHHLDLIEDELPAGDVCFVRQVLQHLSNAQISAILPKLSRYRWVYVTEHYPSDQPGIRPNLDKVHGGDVRLYDKSGVYLDAAPFSLPPQRLQLVLEVPGHAMDDDPGVIRTFLYRPPGGGAASA